ncbi:MAG: helix-turn-helix domain-containing protein [Lachnospiraceae bacterium]|nr:helix-turn-helix domain-containing protein [Lachnospiraceae bacterium]
MEAREGFGADLKFCQEADTGKHQHSDIYLYYLLEGRLLVEVNGESWELQKDDVLVVNSGYSCSCRQAGETLYCVVRMDYEWLQGEIDTDYVTFWCNSARGSDMDYKPVREIMGSLLTEYAVNGERLNFRKKSLFYSLMDCLLNYYVAESKTRSETMSEDRQLRTALQYIKNHYQRPLSLSEVAGQVYMTASAFSRYFKKKAGINFLEYLNNLRLQKAVEDLLFTDRKLTEIALDHGFTTPSMFSNAFQAAYGEAPSEYRKRRRETQPPQREQDAPPDYSQRLAKYLAEQRRQKPLQENVFQREISVDVSVSRPFRKRWNEVICAGYAPDLLSARLQKHILQLRDELGFSCVRLSNIFSWDMQMRKDRRAERLNFERIDSVLDFIVMNKMHPVIDLGDKPKRVLRNAGNPLFVDVHPPIFQSMEESRWIFEAFSDHIAARYGSTETEKWRFDLWKDNREERGSGIYDYIEAFQMICGIIKQRIPGARMGGTGFELGSEVSREELGWQGARYRPDFISVAAFPYKRELPGFRVQAGPAQRSTDFHFMRNELRKLKRSLGEAGLGGIPVEFSEWNLSLSDRNFYNDSCGKAAHMLMNMVELGDEIETGAYFSASDLAVSYYDSEKMFFGGTGLLSKDGLPKPAYHALYFMQKMGNFIVGSGDGYLVTTNGQSSYYLILFHYKRFNYNYFTKKEEIRPENLTEIYTDRDLLELRLNLNRIADGSYTVKTYRVGEDRGNALGQWMELSQEVELNISDIEYLKRICVPHIRMELRTVTGGSLLLKERLRPHDICYIHIHKNNDRVF